MNNFDNTKELVEDNNDIELLKLGENLLTTSENKYTSVIRLAQYTKLMILEQMYHGKEISNSKPLITALHNFEYLDEH